MYRTAGFRIDLTHSQARHISRVCDSQRLVYNWDMRDNSLLHAVKYLAGGPSGREVHTISLRRDATRWCLPVSSEPCVERVWHELSPHARSCGIAIHLAGTDGVARNGGALEHGCRRAPRMPTVCGTRSGLTDPNRRRVRRVAGSAINHANMRVVAAQTTSERAPSQ